MMQKKNDRIIKMKPKLSDIVDIRIWREMQDIFAKNLGISISLVDLSGEEIIVSGEKPMLCTLIERNDISLCKNNRITDKSGRFSINRCMGLIDITAPIIMNSTKMGFLVFSGIRAEETISAPEGIDIDHNELAGEFEKLKFLDEKDIENLTRNITAIAESLPKIAVKMKNESKKIKKTELLSKITSIMDSSDVETILTNTADYLTELFQIKNCSVVIFDLNVRHSHISYAPRNLIEVERIVAKQIISTNHVFKTPSIKEDIMFSKVSKIEDLDFFLLSFPITSQRKAIGMLNFYGSPGTNTERFDPDLLTFVANKISKAMHNILHLKQVQKSAMTDKLTGLFNRQHFAEIFNQHISEGKEEKQPISLIIFDIDDFKFYNDTHGHLEGDKILSRFGAVLKENSSKDIIPFRYGGEEFVVLLPGQKQEPSKAFAEKIRKLTRENVGVSVSAGVITCLNSSLSRDEMIKEADKAMYKAKRTGKNKVISFVVVDKSLGVIDTDAANDLYTNKR